MRAQMSRPSALIIKCPHSGIRRYSSGKKDSHWFSKPPPKNRQRLSYSSAVPTPPCASLCTPNSDAHTLLVPPKQVPFQSSILILLEKRLEDLKIILGSELDALTRPSSKMQRMTKLHHRGVRMMRPVNAHLILKRLVIGGS